MANLDLRAKLALVKLWVRTGLSISMANSEQQISNASVFPKDPSRDPCA